MAETGYRRVQLRAAKVGWWARLRFLFGGGFGGGLVVVYLHNAKAHTEAHVAVAPPKDPGQRRDVLEAVDVLRKELEREKAASWWRRALGGLVGKAKGNVPAETAAREQGGSVPGGDRPVRTPGSGGAPVPVPGVQKVAHGARAAKGRGPDLRNVERAETPAVGPPCGACCMGHHSRCTRPAVCSCKACRGRRGQE